MRIYRTMRIKFLVILLSVVVVSSCKKDSDQTVEVEIQEDKPQKNNLLTRKDIEDLSYSDYVLSSEAEKLIADWEKFQEFNAQIGFS